MAFIINDSYNIISCRISNVGISFTQIDTHTETQTIWFFFLSDKPIGASPLTKCRLSHSLFRLCRMWGGVGGGELKKGGNTPRAMESQRCKSSASHESFQHHLLHHTPCCLLSWQNTISRVSTIPHTHPMSCAVMLYIHTLLYVIPYC